MRALIAGVVLAASVAGVAYLALALQRTIAFGRRRAAKVESTERTPPVTILKPLRGIEPNLLENLSSFCNQDYPDFQVIFGVREADDPAVAVAREVIARFPARDLGLVVDGRVHGSNLKISNVMNMMGSAKHDIIIVADSDIAVEPSYLRCVVPSFADKNVGAVSCVYRGVPIDGGYVRELGALFVNDQFAPSVLVATAFSPMDFCLGATMGVTRSALESIGGFAALSLHLADDQMLGKLVRRSGRRVELCPAVVELSVADPSIAALWDHEIRWARTMRTAQPWGFSFSFITYALPLALVYAVVSGNPPVAATLAGVAAALRVSLHYAVRWALDIRARDCAWLIPLRDFLGLAVWAVHFFGRGVRWRGSKYTVDAQGRLHEVCDRLP
jgi:ceramide glucosyltransferase